ncbi:MAG: pyridoxal-phosphate dependent enzyme [Deltaproteobacteria bacterium]|nr:pyridoxal-phosphate dependent enzyme [Deltaproteobacteria bacterium]
MESVQIKTTSGCGGVTKYCFAQVPTPLEYNASLSRELDIRVYIKREDLIDQLASGNKLRKLEYLLWKGINSGASCFLSAGSTQSNQCKALAYTSNMLGKRCYLIYAGDVHKCPTTVTGNYLLSIVFGAEIIWREHLPWAVVNQEIDSFKDILMEKDEFPFIIFPGASEWPGILGYVEAANELAKQEASAGISIDHVISAFGSGGTATGVAFGAVRLKKPWTIWGSCISESRCQAKHRVDGLIDGFPQRLDESVRSLPNLLLFDGAMGKGYDVHDFSEVDFIFYMARKHNIIIDPNYVGKAFQALFQLRKINEIKSGQTVVVIHSGGMHGFLGGSSALDSILT